MASHRFMDQAARRLTEALRSISRSQCATAVPHSPNFQSTLLPRQRRLSAVRSHTGEVSLGCRERARGPKCPGSMAGGLAWLRRCTTPRTDQGVREHEKGRDVTESPRLGSPFCSAPATWPARFLRSIALSEARERKRRSGRTTQDLRLVGSRAKSGMVFMITLSGRRETASSACSEDRYRVRAAPWLDGTCPTWVASRPMGCDASLRVEGLIG